MLTDSGRVEFNSDDEFLEIGKRTAKRRIGSFIDASLMNTEEGRKSQGISSGSTLGEV
jgi:hypothetical protein